MFVIVRVAFSTVPDSRKLVLVEPAVAWYEKAEVTPELVAMSLRKVSVRAAPAVSR